MCPGARHQLKTQTERVHYKNWTSFTVDTSTYMYEKRHLKGVVYKFCKYFYYWSDFPEIYTQDVKLKIKRSLFL